MSERGTPDLGPLSSGAESPPVPEFRLNHRRASEPSTLYLSRTGGGPAPGAGRRAPEALSSMYLLPERRLSICFVSDFYFPNFGGVESHQYQLAQCLIERGHKVVLITHAYGDRVGVRYMSSGMKVYYIPVIVMTSAASLPSIFGFFSIFRDIAIREQIDVVHGHQAFSSLCQESMLHARTMGIRTCFTDHSLFGFADLSSILTNKVLKWTLSDVDHSVCVSHTSRENTVLRAALDPGSISVIPNAITSIDFKPHPEGRPSERPTRPGAATDRRITVVVLSRLVYRKGVDPLLTVIPRICAAFPEVDFLIGGDGPKRVPLEQMREQYRLHQRVELIGAVAHRDVRDVLIRGDIFLNTSLTEAFCIAIVEAASCGLSVVSTRVGGVPEVLPRGMIQFANPEVEDLIAALSNGIRELPRFPPAWELHRAVRAMYSWRDVAHRVEQVYFRVLDRPHLSLLTRARRHASCGAIAGLMAVAIVLLDHLLLAFLDWAQPAEAIDQAPYFDPRTYDALLGRLAEATDEGAARAQ
ncbi:phosphatidylinositol glycan, class A [Fonticula alba]|uniref:phosphatidylinositol N-acetylglucosaminyltransferase n=1 Tax=Fonticula alba TaxID=691883 RepID=A0A058Z1J3_FONAL|nr:phosphatidylinositol glycan, class A [Fonticula alba]KCV67808.1 phosphatidylinositol glycan, class A [Fonticula alba]|eukprot:XP_009497839.1 phosphatidylinositol glycan, class A [Fonticula alba]